MRSRERIDGTARNARLEQAGGPVQPFSPGLMSMVGTGGVVVVVVVAGIVPLPLAEPAAFSTCQVLPKLCTSSRLRYVFGHPAAYL